MRAQALFLARSLYVYFRFTPGMTKYSWRNTIRECSASVVDLVDVNVCVSLVLLVLGPLEMRGMWYLNLFLCNCTLMMKIFPAINLGF